MNQDLQFILFHDVICKGISIENLCDSNGNITMALSDDHRIFWILNERNGDNITSLHNHFNDCEYYIAKESKTADTCFIKKNQIEQIIGLTNIKDFCDFIREILYGKANSDEPKKCKFMLRLALKYFSNLETLQKNNGILRKHEGIKNEFVSKYKDDLEMIRKLQFLECHSFADIALLEYPYKSKSIPNDQR